MNSAIVNLRVDLTTRGLNIHVIATDTGELLRALTLNPKTGYQPRFKVIRRPCTGDRNLEGQVRSDNKNEHFHF